MSNRKQEGNLTGLRVLDIAQGGAQVCGKILADLGADVIKIEPPGGDLTGRIAPFFKDIPDPQKSLFWFAYNTSKRGITLNLKTSDEQIIFKKLAEKADILIETYSPGYLDNLGIGYSELSEINSRLIVTSITPYGQSGPKALLANSELTSLGEHNEYVFKELLKMKEKEIAKALSEGGITTEADLPVRER